MLTMPKQIQNQLETNSVRLIHPGEVLREEFLAP